MRSALAQSPLARCPASDKSVDITDATPSHTPVLLVGNAGNDTIQLLKMLTGSGNDTFVGGSGFDTMIGTQIAAVASRPR